MSVEILSAMADVFFPSQKKDGFYPFICNLLLFFQEFLQVTFSFFPSGFLILN